jgi:RNA polymerase sigma-70 factor (ECF subfamily)
MVDWDDLVREHGATVFGIAWRILGHAQDAEDVSQEVFAQASRQSNGIPVVCWPGLLRRMTTCRAMNALRRRRITIPLDCTELTRVKDDPQAIAAGHELEARRRAALAKLAPREAEVFYLRYFEDLSYREIAETLGISATAASTALYQARSRLEKLLTQPAKRGVP